MISYEELCEALNRFNTRKANQSEFDTLEKPSYSDSPISPSGTVEVNATDVIDEL